MSHNKHLKDLLSKLDNYSGVVPWDFMVILGGELIFSKMYYAFPDYEYIRDENGYVHIFTSPEEYMECYDESVMRCNYFEDPFLYFNSEDGEGVIINPKTDNLKIPTEDINSIRYEYDVEYGMYHTLKISPKKIKKIKKIKNHHIERLIKNSNVDCDELLKAILDSEVLILVGDNGEKIAKDIIKREYGGYYTDEEGYVCIYSSWDEVVKSNHENVFVTVPVHESYFTYVLFNDFEGVKLNDNIVFSREVLIRNIVSVVHTSREKPMKKYSEYALKIR